MPYKLTAAAAADLTDIAVHGLYMFGAKQAARYHKALRATFELLSDMPLLGREDSRRPGLRRFVHGSHVLLYESQDEGVLIVRVVHAATRIASDP